MSVRPSVRRGATVSLAAIALCCASTGIAAAGTSPLPPVPDPGSTVTTVEQTVTSTVNQVTAQPTTAPTVAPTTAPAPTAAKSAGTTATGTTTKHVATKPASGQRAAHPAAPAPSGTSMTTTSYAAPALSGVSLRLPPETSVAAAPGAVPAIAPAALAPVTIRPAANAGALDNVANHKGSLLRGLLLLLAVGAAGALSFEHLRIARRQLAG